MYKKDCIDCVCNPVCKLKSGVMQAMQPLSRDVDIGSYELMDFIADKCLCYVNKHKITDKHKEGAI